MKSQEKNLIEKYAFDPSSAATITLSKGSDEAGERLARFCDELKQLAPQVMVKNDSDVGFVEPAAVVGRHKNIAYAAVPSEKMLPMFLDALNRLPTDGNPEADALEAKINEIELPAAVTLYVADQCPHCPQAIRQIQNLAAQTPLVRLNIVNAEAFPDRARSDDIRSVPTLIVDDGYRWVGQLDLQEILEICIHRDPSSLSVDSLRQLVENGDAPRLATMITESGKIFPALFDLITHQRWSVRLGAMVAVEYLADDAPDLVLTLCGTLWSNFSDLSPPVQGDVTHLFGLVDTDVTRANLRTVAAGNYDKEVKEAAAEELAGLGA